MFFNFYVILVTFPLYEYKDHTLGLALITNFLLVWFGLVYFIWECIHSLHFWKVQFHPLFSECKISEIELNEWFSFKMLLQSNLKRFFVFQNFVYFLIYAFWNSYNISCQYIIMFWNNIHD